MKRISSRATSALKWWLPVLWVVLFVGAVATREPGVALAWPLLTAVAFAALYRWAIWPLADSVDDSVDALVVRRHGEEQRVRLADIARITAMPFFNPPLVHLHLCRPGPLGERIVFLPQKDFRIFLAPGHPVVDELTTRIERAVAREARP